MREADKGSNKNSYHQTSSKASGGLADLRKEIILGRGANQLEAEDFMLCYSIATTTGNKRRVKIKMIMNTRK